VALISLPLAGCSEEDTNTINVEQLTQGITTTAENTETYQYAVSSETDASIETDTGITQYKSSAESNGIVDNRNVKMQVTMSMESEGPEGTFSWVTEQYIINNMIYTKSVTSGMPEQWTKQPLTSEIWEEQPIEMQIELIENSEIEISGSEKVNGVECWVVELLAIQEAYWETQDLMSPEELSIKFWFAKDTYYLIKAETEMTYLESGDSTTTRVEIVFSHYNEPVSIELPEEAEAATEIPG